MKILLDVDGVVADFVKGLEMVLGHTFSSEDKKHWAVHNRLDRATRNQALEEMADAHFWESLPLMEGAKEGVNYLETMGHQIVWVTSPWPSCESWDSARAKWLEKHFDIIGKKHHLIIAADKSDVKGDVFIDDKPSHVREWSKKHPEKKAFIYDAPHNQNIADFPRFTWEKVRDLL